MTVLPEQRRRLLERLRLAVVGGQLAAHRRGEDIATPDRSLDAHVRLEYCPMLKLDQIMVDIYDSSIQDPDAAHVESQDFRNTPSGANEATNYVRSWGFEVTILPGKPGTGLGR